MKKLPLFPDQVCLPEGNRDVTRAARDRPRLVRPPALFLVWPIAHGLTAGTASPTLDLDQECALSFMVASSKGSESDLLEELFVLSAVHLETPQHARCLGFGSSERPAGPLAQPTAARPERRLVQSASAHRTDGLC
jgi:hypothetical protein